MEPNNTSHNTLADDVNDERIDFFRTPASRFDTETETTTRTPSVTDPRNDGKKSKRNIHVICDFD
jgi:hypothetical protein